MKKNIQLLLLCASSLSAQENNGADLPTAQTLASHIQTMREIKSKATQQTSAAEKEKRQSAPVHSQSQTDAYLSITELKAEVDKNFGKEIAERNLQPLINQILQQERDLADNYYVFYHGQKMGLKIVQDVVREIMSWLNITTFGKGFEFLRTPGLEQFRIEKDLYDFLAEKFKQYDAHINYKIDTQNEMVELLLSTNLSLFGNVFNIKGGECSFDYFLRGFSFSDVSPEELLQEFLRTFGFNQSYLPKLTKLYPAETSFKGGLLQQIFVPKNSVDKVAYFSGVGGMPPLAPAKTASRSWTGDPGELLTPIMSGKSVSEIEEMRKTLYPQEKFFWEQSEPWFMLKFSKISKLLELYENSPQTLITELGNIPSKAAKLPGFEKFDELQARLLITEKTFLNPESGIKIYRYTEIAPKIEHEYGINLTKIINQMMLDWIAQKQKESAASGSSSAEKLIKYIQEHPRTR